MKSSKNGNALNITIDHINCSGIYHLFLPSINYKKNYKTEQFNTRSQSIINTEGYSIFINVYFKYKTKYLIND